MTTDPVCGMSIDEKKVAAHAEHGGTTYYFCSQGCHDKFVADPTAALREPRRVCAPGGRVVLTIWAAPADCEQRDIFKAMRGAPPFPPPDNGPFALSGAEVLEQLLEQGVGLLSVTGTLGGYLNGSPSAVSDIVRWLGRDVYITFYVPNFVLVLLVITAVDLTAMELMGRQRGQV
jgi:YHS domain-containing protein